MTRSKNSNKLKLLCIGSQKNKVLIESLSKQYDLTTCQYVLPKSIESKLGNLKLEYPLFQYDAHWELGLGNDINIQSISWDFGIDLNLPQIEKATLAINLKYYLAVLFSSLGFSINVKGDKSISTLLEQNTLHYYKLAKTNGEIKIAGEVNIYIKESDLDKFDLIIIENQMLRTNIEKHLDDPYASSLDDYFTRTYYLYNVAPSVINNLFDAGKKILIFIDDLEFIEQIDQDCFRRYHSYLKKMFQLEIVLLDNNINKLITKSSSKRYDDYFLNFPHFLNVADKSQCINNDIRNFHVEVNSIYIKNIFPLFKYFWESLKIEKLIVSSLISFRNLDKDYKGNNVLTGNKGSTGYCKLYSNQTTFDDVNLIYDYNPSIGILELSKSNKFSLIPNSLVKDENLMNNEIGNMKFVNEITKSLVDPDEFFRNSEFGLTPRIVLKIDKPQLIINGVKIFLIPMEFCYYRFFLERSLGRKPPLSLKNENTLNSKYKPNLENIPAPIIKKILKYYEDSFHEKVAFSRLSDKLDLGNTPKINQTFIPHIYNINKKITNTLTSKVDENFLKKLLIQSKGLTFYISAKPQFIKIIQN